MTCRQLRQTATNDMLRDALICLDNDWVEANLVHLLRGHRSWYPQRTLAHWGYRSEDIVTIVNRLPCYGCLRLCSYQEHFLDHTVSQYSSQTSLLAQIYQRFLNVPPTRRCISCFFKSDAYLERPGSRWLSIPTPLLEPPNWMAICRECGQKTPPGRRKEPPARQKRADLCDQCYNGLHPAWLDFQSQIESRRRDLNQQVSRIKDKIDPLLSYQHWMRSVDGGQSVLEGRPEDLEGFEMPNWEDIRPDALDGLPKQEESMWPYIGS